MIAAGGLLAGSTVIGLLPTMAGASSHREAPLIAADPAVDNTDVYAFSSPENHDNVAFVANWIPFEEPNGGPNFYPWSDDAEYLINIDNDGDALADIIYRWKFSTEDRRGTETFLYNNGPVTSLDDENLLFRQSFTLDVSTDGGATYGEPVATGPVAPSYTGPASMGSSQDYVDNLRTPAETPVGEHGMTLTTQTEDPFFLDLRIFDLLYGGDLSETGQDTLAGYNVNSIVLEVPKSEVAIDGNAMDNPVIGVWRTTTRPTLRDADGTAAEGNTGFTQVSRLGNPLVNEVVVPTGLKDAFNAISPDMDAEAADGAVVDRVLNPEVPALIEAIYGIPAPETPRSDLFEVFLTGITNDFDGRDFGFGPFASSFAGADLNSQVLNAGGVAPEEFQPSEMLRLNMSITGPTGLNMEPLHEASRLGVIGGDIQGFPNGRRLADDVVDIELLALEKAYDANNLGAAAPLANGDGVNSNDNAFSAHFPYIAGPNTQAVNKGGGTGAGGTDMPPGNGTPGKPMVPASSGGAGAQAGSGAKPPAQPVAVKPQANGYPRGGVETGAGGVEDTLIPALTGSAALLLIGAGAGSLIRGRAVRRAAGSGSEV
ncbi:MAG: FIG01133373: hypothetical protein [uncultured Blastococcus sp.]|uniref:DUF4331 domain-containing protein n=1 Tax=uncultured Blastococcus sp. TaxID=217144 RepID=A0A6J4IZ83_9ACTN|nr:MAG: FIG01133373: hypothetical protein [uncultured Blastococcus sp.]